MLTGDIDKLLAAHLPLGELATIGDVNGFRFAVFTMWQARNLGDQSGRRHRSSSQLFLISRYLEE